MVMYSFKDYIKRRDEVNYNPNLGNILPNSIRQNVDFSIPTAAMKTGAAALQGVGTLAGGMIAALSGIPVTIASMQSAKTRFERAQRYILGYLQNRPGMKQLVLGKVNEALGFLENNQDIGYVPHGFGGAIWNGIKASFGNLYDTLMNKNVSPLLGQLKIMLESLGQMNKEVAYGKLMAFKQAAEVGETYIDPDTYI